MPKAKGKPIIYIASKESAIAPGKKTDIHFDIHRNVNYFSNHEEMNEKIKKVIEKNRDSLFKLVEDKILQSTLTCRCTGSARTRLPMSFLLT